MPLDYAFDLQPFMSWGDRKVGRLGANRLVLAQGHGYRFPAIGSGALAAETDRLPVRFTLLEELRGHLGYALIDLSKERFILGATFVLRLHESTLSPTLDWLVKFR